MMERPVDKVGQRIKTIFADLKRYIEKRLELIVVSFSEESARWLAESIQKVSGILLLFAALFFLLVALALYLGALLNSRSLGFVLVSIPLLVAGYILLKQKSKRITQKLKTDFEDEFLRMVSLDDSDEPKSLPRGDTNEEPEFKNEPYGGHK